MSHDFVEGEFASTIGKVRYAITSATHVSINGSVTVRQIPYRVGLHLFRHNDGKWRTQEEGKNPDYHNPYLNREDDKRWEKEPSQAARLSIKETLIAAWEGYIVKCPEKLPQAGLLNLQGQIASKAEECATAKNKLEELRVELAALRAQLPQ
jgi:hypothetical protein